MDETKENMDYTKTLNVINSAITSSFLSEEKQGALSKQLDRIKKRISDNKIYLGIVGEFSTGKSTLINSLISENFSTCTVEIAIRPS